MNSEEFEDRLAAERALKQRMRDAGIDPADPAEREAWEAGTDATLADVAAVLAETRARYSRVSGLEHVNGDDMLAYLVMRIFPPVPGEPVRFQRLGGRRWLRGTVEGPVSNPDDPQRHGDIWVRTASGQREAAFLASLRRADPRPAVDGTGD